MSKVRNGVIIIILCIIGAYTFLRHGGQDVQVQPPAPEQIRDAVAAAPAHNKPKGLQFTPGDNNDDLRDTVAEHPALPGGPNQGPHGNTEDQTPPPPRGGGNGGFGLLSGPNPNSEIPPPVDVSPSGPQDNQDQINLQHR